MSQDNDIAIIEMAVDADFNAVLKTTDNSFQHLNLLTIEWAEQSYNLSEWRPRPWPGEG